MSSENNTYTYEDDGAFLGIICGGIFMPEELLNILYGENVDEVVLSIEFDKEKQRHYMTATSIHGMGKLLTPEFPNPYFLTRTGCHKMTNAEKIADLWLEVFKDAIQFTGKDFFKKDIRVIINNPCIFKNRMLYVDNDTRELIFSDYLKEKHPEAYESVEKNWYT